MSDDKKAMDEVYTQRAEAFLLAMALAKEKGLEVGVRAGTESSAWPVHLIVLEDGSEISQHISASDAIPAVLPHTTDRKYVDTGDWKQENKDKAEAIKRYVNKVFGAPKQEA